MVLFPSNCSKLIIFPQWYKCSTLEGMEWVLLIQSLRAGPKSCTHGPLASTQSKAPEVLWTPELYLFFILRSGGMCGRC